MCHEDFITETKTEKDWLGRPRSVSPRLVSALIKVIQCAENPELLENNKEEGVVHPATEHTQAENEKLVFGVAIAVMAIIVFICIMVVAVEGAL